MKAGKSSWADPLLRPIAAISVPRAGLEVTVEPTEPERAALASALNLASVDQLVARYQLSHRAGGVLLVTGEIVARVKPVCVVSLVPFDLRVKEPVEVRYSEEVARRDADEFDMLAGDEPPDPLENGTVDLGKVTTEFLSLAIPPFPRRPEAAFASEQDDPSPSPFAGLAALKAKPASE